MVIKMATISISMSKLIAGIVIAVLASSAISVGVSTILITGLQGPEGPQGPKGDAGLQGPEGPQGERGETGAIGPAGEMGATGATGPQGIPGPQGPYLPDYDSGWINITDKAGQYFNITHNLNYGDILVDIVGKTEADGGVHQRHLGLTSWPGWTKTYGGTGNDEDEAYSVVQTFDGGFALAGTTESFGAGSYDVYLVRTDGSGDILWSKTYGGTSDDYGWSVLQTSDGGYAIAGITQSFGAGGYDMYLIKTDVAGTMQWSKTYGGTSYDVAWSVVQTFDGGFALAGTTLSFGAGGTYDMYLVKTDPAGTMQWNKTYGGTSGDKGRSVVQTEDGGFALTGYTQSFGVGYFPQVYLVKTDAAGTMQWNKMYGGTGWEEGRYLVQTSDGGYIITGETESYGGGPQVYLIKTDASGNMSWSKTYGGKAYDNGWSVIQTSDGSYAIAGHASGFGFGIQMYLVRTDVELGLCRTDKTVNTVTLYRGANDPYWNFVRVRIWKID